MNKVYYHKKCQGPSFQNECSDPEVKIDVSSEYGMGRSITTNKFQCPSFKNKWVMALKKIYFCGWGQNGGWSQNRG